MCLHHASQLKHLGIAEGMQYLTRSKMFHKEVVTLLCSVFPGGGGGGYIIAVVEDKNSHQSETWQASIYVVSVLH